MGPTMPHAARSGPSHSIAIAVDGCWVICEVQLHLGSILSHKETSHGFCAPTQSLKPWTGALVASLSWSHMIS